MISVTNFRDLGEIQNKDGYQIKKGVFLRSGELTSLPKADEQRLKQEFRLAKVIDFRSETEIKERPNKIIPNTSYVTIDILSDIKDEGASITDFIRIGSQEKAEEYMGKLYEEIVLNVAAQQGYRQFFQEILKMRQDESLLFHCFAGKDRTGIAAAFLLEALDVPKKTIYIDYLLTNELRKTANAQMIAKAQAAGLKKENLSALQVALNVKSTYIDHLYTAINRDYGDMSIYLKEVLDIDQQMKQELCTRFLNK